ncbi:amidohydrolase family protein [Sphingomonas sp. CLY1604]|uniref:amidohydrolase family protein n=1 Tax=Sphingomonas sp. CLY1604 TaxID=3457786 RepID=UPI003FD6E5D7
MRVFDSHVHVWRIDAPGHQWPDADWPLIHCDFALDDLRAEARDVDLAGVILVQSQPDDRDTDWLLADAANDALVAGVVGWVDFTSPQAPDRIATLARNPRLRGLRPMLQGIADTDWILDRALDPVIAAMIEHGLRFDALIQPRHLPVLHAFATRWPDLPIVIDHGAKPAAADGTLDPWRNDMAAVAALPQVHCKLSGLRTEQAQGQAADELAPYVAHLVSCFGDRLMWGSDWPVLRHAGDRYTDWIATAQALTGLTGDAAASLFEGAARRFYDVDAA